MDKVYDHKKVEERIYAEWEKNGYFKPEVNPDGRSYSIILPPPNANAPLHFGHAMYVIEDILIRYQRMKGAAALWLPGADHAGFETQFVFEKHLANEGKSRFDYDRETLYQMIWDFVQENRGGMESQLRKLGFSLDWSRMKFTLDPDIISIVYRTFRRLYDDGLVYRAKRLVNYCTYDGTSFSDLEVVYEERKNPLYYIKYGPLTLATTRPETKFGDTAVAVHPDDKRYKKYIGQEIEIKTVLGKAKIKVIADDSVDPEFGTGVVKITPAHDFNDFEVGQRHNLKIRQVIGFDGKMNEHAGKFAGLYVKQARKAVVEEMQKKGLIEKIDDNYIHRIGLCYKCKNVIEPLPREQWFVKMEPLARPAIDAVRKGKIEVHPKSFEKIYFQFLENIRDWNISRQIVWGIRIPAWFCEKCLNWTVTDGITPEKCLKCESKTIAQDPDTFDTWFSSAQWPFATLLTQSSSKSKIKNQKSKIENSLDYERFYPTTVMETGYDILRWWVARMVIVGIYATGKVPFENVVLHGLVKDPYGKKMSKSKGNVVNPIEVVEQYGADAVRFALVYGTALGNDQALSYAKLQGMRNFTNKLWNIGRFIEMNRVSSIQYRVSSIEELKKIAKRKNDKEWVAKVDELTNQLTNNLDNYQFNLAAERLYEFIWHEFADKYIEDVKIRIDKDSYLILTTLYLILLRLLHPFMPFITEELCRKLGAKDSIMVSSWPAK
ncbi:MAG: valine--tRNA ligase [Candidatus Levybacteria bacterium RIFCSPHIGHO2_01_FULL_40_58]|nr:MAG: valine--tRNA ligase [Candidatus Levybacteria bacterium RIFCSPHIGHO2_01_FULL_40_58]OGH40037.1 MAG: valine--tRNA ligase [Candidatus Levybacteria bacterium RIFCSPLOWO2_01_FULL_40_64]OGH54253.1 MAG: valine--tRNA ligase [Candidatus Levybacteria bacterium RIFCSPLOWO2_12_FULL_40_10]